MKASTKPPAKSNKPQSFKDKGSVAGKTYSASARTPATVVLRNLRELEVSANQGAEKLEPEELEELVELLMSEVMSKVETGMLCEDHMKEEVISKPQPIGESKEQQNETVKSLKASSKRNSSKELIKLESRKSIMFDSGKVETQVALEEIPLSNVTDKVKVIAI
uniref:Ty3-gypsy retrotransposon protein n=1 Tax=Angiostrongylus cantonensis TaxID=6313 RepID=A0A158PAD2_ANGCA